ncbi:hypothetical protein BGZ63DRAFT_338807, partial [Mariannaea sp. PMI_226]
IQVIVKMASIELTPENPTFAVGNWHVKGQMNEHSVGKTLYYANSENSTLSRLAFYFEIAKGQLGSAQPWMEQRSRAHGLQKYGSVEAKKGRLLALPNLFHHQVLPFKLEDRSQPGH